MRTAAAGVTYKEFRALAGPRGGLRLAPRPSEVAIEIIETPASKLADACATRTKAAVAAYVGRRLARRTGRP